MQLEKNELVALMRNSMPGSVGFSQKIMPPAPLAVQDEMGNTLPAGTVPNAPSAVRPTAPTGLRRVCVSWGPEKGEVVVSVEEAPDWDVTASYIFPIKEAEAFAPLIRALGIKIKPLLGPGYFLETPTTPEVPDA